MDPEVAPTDVAFSLQPTIDPLAHSHIYKDIKEIKEEHLENDILEFKFPECSRANPLIAWTHIRFSWPNGEEMGATYYIAVLTPTEVIPLSKMTSIRRNHWMPLPKPIPAMPLEDSKIVAVVNIYDNRTIHEPTFIAMRLAGFDHLYRYNENISFDEGLTLVDNGLKAKFVPNSFQQ
jgi:hypothetical protein